MIINDRRGLRTAAAVLLVFAACGTIAPGKEQPPNIVLIVADDLGWGDVGFNGRTEWSTPNLDRLAGQGVVLKRCYSAATVCAPSRAALLTGKYTIHSGVRRNDEDLPAEEVTIAEALRSRGYATALFGKWHSGKPRGGRLDPVHPMDQGFDEFLGYTDAVKGWEKYPRTLWDGRREVAVSGYFDDLITDRALDFVGSRQGKPFFLEVAYIASHFHIAAPAEDVERYRGKFRESDPARPVQATYAAMVTRLDRNIGRLIARLDERGLAANTLIVFTSDNGATFEKGNAGREFRPGQQPSVSRPEANALGGRHPGARTGALAGPDPRGVRVRGQRPPGRSLADVPGSRGGDGRSRPAYRWSEPAAGLGAPGAPNPSEPCSGNGRARATISSPPCAATSSSSSREAVNPSFTTSSPIPKSAGTSPPVIPS